MDPMRDKCKVCRSGYAGEVDELLRQRRTYNEIIYLMKDKIPGLKSSHITSHKKHPAAVDEEIQGLQQSLTALRQNLAAPPSILPQGSPKPMDDMELLEAIKNKAVLLFDRTTDPGAMQKLAMIVIEIIRLKYEITGTIYAPPPKLLAMEETLKVH
ncbi:MAG: hypothetical protein QMC96_03430 [Methanomicrobiales archaeon]|nr:hypothetical protein [Methanomicrobiales archaeon]